MNGFIAAAVCTGLLAGLGAMTFSARAAENETADIPEATEKYTGTLPVASESVVTTVTASDENSELEELRSKGQLVGGFGQSLLDDFRRVGGTVYEPVAQLVDRWRLDEQAQCAVAVLSFDVAAAFHVDVKDDVFASCRLRFYLRFQRAIETVLVDLFVLQKLAGLYLFLEFVGGEEEIFHTIALCAAWRTACAADGEGQL